MQMKVSHTIPNKVKFSLILNWVRLISQLTFNCLWRFQRLIFSDTVLSFFDCLYFCFQMYHWPQNINIKNNGNPVRRFTHAPTRSEITQFE